jgi:hypothetical protein
MAHHFRRNSGRRRDSPGRPGALARRPNRPRWRLHVNASWFARRAAAALLGALALSLAMPAAAGEGWELRRPGITLVVEGDRADADRALARVLLIQDTARLLLGWPTDFKPRPALVFVISEDLTRRVFVAADVPLAALVMARALRGQMLGTPALVATSVPLKPERGHELERLQDIYGGALLGEAPTAAWPECARQGFGMLLNSAEYTTPGHLFIGGQKVAAVASPLEPARAFAPPLDSDTQVVRERRDYACYLLAQRYATGDATLRAAIARLYTNVGAGNSLEAAIPAALGGTLAKFTAQMSDAAEYHADKGHELDIAMDFALPQPLADEATALDAAHLEALVNQFCGKLGSCKASE